MTENATNQEQAEQKAPKSDFATKLETMSDEQANEVARLVAEDQARRHQDARDAEVLARGTNAEAREMVKRRHGYLPDY